MKIYKYGNIQIYINIHVENNKCEKHKKVLYM